MSVDKFLAGCQGEGPNKTLHLLVVSMERRSGTWGLFMGGEELFPQFPTYCQ